MCDTPALILFASFANVLLTGFASALKCLVGNATGLVTIPTSLVGIHI